MAQKIKRVEPHLYESRRDATRNPPYAHLQIALAYAKHLSPELHMAVNEEYMWHRGG